MRKNIRNAKLRVSRVLAYFNVNIRAVIFANSAVERKRNSCPLIFFNSAVVVSFEKSEISVLINRALL